MLESVTLNLKENKGRKGKVFPMIVWAVIDRQGRNLVKEGILESTGMGRCACGLYKGLSEAGSSFEYKSSRPLWDT